METIKEKLLSRLDDIVTNWKTQSPHGFNHIEEYKLLEFIGRDNLNMEKYYDALKGNTCMMGPHGIIMYHCDILTALRCALEDRDMYLEEWD